MSIDKLEKVNFTSLSQEVMRLIRKHCKEDEVLEKDLHNLIKLIESEEEKSQYIRESFYKVLSKL